MYACVVEYRAQLLPEVELLEIADDLFLVNWSNFDKFDMD